MNIQKRLGTIAVLIFLSLLLLLILFPLLVIGVNAVKSQEDFYQNGPFSWPTKIAWGQLREAAEENRATGGDPKGVDRLIAQAQDLQGRAEECRKLVEKAISAEDSKAAVEEGIRGQQLVEQAQALIAQAKPMSEGASAAAGPDAEKAAAMKLWSDRVMAGG